jgi:hypothetical protein
MWNAAHELLNGHLREPAFFGQDYNTCLEGYLAAPFIAMGASYNVAVPLVALILGLLPFVLIAIVAWRRKHPLVSATALLVPLILPIRYGMITGMPRGFVTGIGFAIFPAILLLPPSRRIPQIAAGDSNASPIDEPTPPSTSRPHDAFRYFLAGLLSVFALFLNPNCAILLLPVLVYAMLSRWREPRFWIFGAIGLIAALPLPLYSYYFYHVAYPDHLAYLHGEHDRWSLQFFRYFFIHYVLSPKGTPSPIFRDLVPLGVSNAPLFLLLAFLLPILVFLMNRRWIASAAAISGAIIVVASFGFDRPASRIGHNSASIPYGRIYLALPVLWLWLLLVASEFPRPRSNSSAAARWAVRGVLATILAAATLALYLKHSHLAATVSNEVSNSSSPHLESVDLIYFNAQQVQAFSDQYDANLLIVGKRARVIAYAIPALTSVETLYVSETSFERRTWRLVEEFGARHNNVLLFGISIPGAQRLNDYYSVGDFGNRSVFDFAAIADLSPPILQPNTVDNPLPYLQVYRVDLNPPDDFDQTSADPSSGLQPSQRLEKP